MKDEVRDKVIDIGAAAAQLEAGVGRVKEAVADAVEERIDTAKRAVKQGRRAVEDLVDEAEHQFKQHPLNTLGVCFGIGLGLGALIGILLARNGHSGR
jgi:ElaB/YqjD/DUF883 family membrane-anchored ribosome-binding protein